MPQPLDRFERFLLCLGVFLAPMRELRPTEIAFTYSDLVFCVLGLLFVIRRRLATMPMQDVTIMWMLANLCLIGGLFVSSIINGSASASLVVCTQYFFAYAFLPFIVMRDEQTGLLLAKTLVFATLFMVVCGFIFVATGYTGDYLYVTGSGRLASFAGNPNDFALLIALCVPVLMYLWFTKSLSTLVCLITFTCFFIGLIMASSNSGIGSTALGVVAFLFLAGNVRWLIKGAAVAMLLIVGAATVGYDYLPEVFQRRVLSAFESGSIDQAGTYTGRMELIIEASDLLDGSLLLGIGADQYRVHSVQGEPVHNQYLLVWVEGGTIAIFGWLMIMATIALIGLRSYMLGRQGAQCAAMVLAISIIFAIVANTSPHLYARCWVIPAFIAIGLTLARRVSETTSAPAEPPTQTIRANGPPQDYRSLIHARLPQYQNRR